MSIPQVGQGAFAVVPTFKGFRKAVTAESDASAKAADTGFRRAFSKTGTESGKQTGQGFKKAFEGQSTGFSSKASRELEQAVSKSAAAVSAARLKEQDSAGKVRLAERQLAEARQKYAGDSSQVIRAEERLATANRQLDNAQEATTRSTKDLRDAQSSLARAADRSADELASAGRRGATNFGTNLTGGIRALGGPLVAAVGALGLGYIIGNALREGFDFALGSIKIASSLNESINAVTVSYGDWAEAILALGDTSALTFAVSKRDLNGYAVRFSSFAKTIAGEGGDVAGTFQSILGRATDFASVMDLEVSDALQLFQSGLAGESEPLRQYGKDLSAATVEAYAYASGIATIGEEFTEQQKIQARYGALMQQTSDVQGDFAKTSEELANKSRTLAASWDDVQAKLGTAFLPIAEKVTTLLADDLIPVISELAEKHGPELAAAFEEALPALIELAQEVLPELPGVIKSVADSLPAMIQAGQTLAPILIWLIEGANGVAATMGAFFELLSGDTSISEVTKEMTALQGPIGDLMRGAYQLGLTIGGVLRMAQMHFQNFKLEVGSRVNEVIGFFEDLPNRITDIFKNPGKWLYDSGKAVIQGFIDGVNTMFKPVGDAVSGVLSWVQGFFPQSPAKRGPFSGSGWTRVADSGAALLEQFESGASRGRAGIAFGDISTTLAATAAPATSSTYTGAPDHLVIVDQDGQLIGRMRVEARGEVKAYATDVSDEDRRGFRGGV